MTIHVDDGGPSPLAMAWPSRHLVRTPEQLVVELRDGKCPQISSSLRDRLEQMFHFRQEWMAFFGPLPVSDERNVVAYLARHAYGLTPEDADAMAEIVAASAPGLSADMREALAALGAHILNNSA